MGRIIPVHGRAIRPRHRRRTAYVLKADTFPLAAFRVYLLTPRGAIWDLTYRVLDLTELDQSLEEDITQATHGDLTLRIDDRDGILERIFLPPTPSDAWRIFILRQEKRRGRITWPRVFTGVVDQPWSLEWDRKTSELRLHVFSMTKLLEFASAEVVKRDLSGLTGTTSGGGSSLVTVSPNTDDLRRGDVFTLSDASSTSPELTITVVISSTQMFVDSAPAAFTGAELQVKTPYHRDYGPAALMDLLIGQTLLRGGTYDINNPISSFPFATPMRTDGLYAEEDDNPRCLTQYDNQIASVIGGPYIEYNTAGPTSRWTVFLDRPALDILPDWTPYRDNEPSARRVASGINSDIGSIDATASADGFEGYAWEFRSGALVIWHLRDVGAGGNLRHQIQKDGVDQLEVWNTGSGARYGTYCEYNHNDDKVWVSAVQDAASYKTIKIYDDGTASLTEISTTIAGALRYLGKRDQMVCMGMDSATERSGNLEVFDATSGTHLKTVPWTVHGWIWTLRAFGDFNAAIFSNGFNQEAGITIWDSSWNQVSHVALVDDASSSGNVYGTRWTDPNTGEEYYVGFLGSGTKTQWFILSTHYAGVVAYADFEGKSAARALRDLAFITGAFITVDHHGSALVQTRDVVLSSALRGARELDTPIAQTSAPLWEFYRASVSISGKTSPGGVEFEVIAGDTGNSALRLELDSDFLPSEGLARALAEGYVGFLNKTRKQETIQGRDTGTPDRPLSVVKLSGRRHLVVDAKSDLRNRRQTLRLAETD